MGAADGGGGWSRMWRSPGFKFFVVGALVILLTIPLALVWLITSERQSRANMVQSEIAADWGAAQRLHGPYLIIPYTVTARTIQGDKTIETQQERRAVFLPDELKVKAGAKTEVRRRAIYDVTVYGADITLDGRFAAPDIAQIESEPANIRWQDAILALGISDVCGLKEGVRLDIAGGPSLPFEPSIGVPNNATTGIHVRLAPAGLFAAAQAAGGNAKPGAGGGFSFRVAIALNGSSSLSFAPVGRETSVGMNSNWPHPSFNGGFLPVERDIGAKGFTARWQVPHLARSVPQSWSDMGARQTPLDRFSGYEMGVSFFVPVDFYNLVDRAAKYGLMFLAVAFGAVFVLELMSGKSVHPVQYILVGLAMVMFYVLLLSFAEHIGFTPAYIVASVATGGMISAYVAKALGQARRGFIMLGVFLVLYAWLYLLLQLEDYALLAGAISGFLLLTATMFATLRVDWSGGAPEAEDAR
jgi:inner membrane protein